MHGAMHVSMQWWSACRFCCPKQSEEWGFVGFWGTEGHGTGQPQRSCQRDCSGCSDDCRDSASGGTCTRGTHVPQIPVPWREWGSWPPIESPNRPACSFCHVLRRMTMGVSRRRPPVILFLLGLGLAKLWAFPLFIRATVKGTLAWRMAPFILDDDRQSSGGSTETSQTSQTAQTTNTAAAPTAPAAAPANPAHPGAHIADDVPPERDHRQTTAQVDRAEDISVALEWKLLFPLLAPGVEDPRPGDKRRLVEARCQDDERQCLEQAHDCVAQTIRDAGEEAITMHSLLTAGIEEKECWGSGWVVKKANSAEPMDEEKALKGYIWVSVEICSPKMRFKDEQTCVRMQRVLDALNSSHRLAANCSCEVHIHLGRMDGRAWSLSTLQRLGSFLWVAEPTLRSIRDPGSPNFNNTFTWGFAMRQRSRLASQLRDGVPGDAALKAISDRQINDVIQRRPATPTKEVAAFAEISKTTSHLELGRLLSGPEKKYRRLGFNFSAFGEEDERARRNPRTMEFRMMDGSVDTALIMGWLAICGTVAESAVGVREKDGLRRRWVTVVEENFGIL
ncbi:hypothetical protein F5144DRAFT_594218 [Chaetomium tenue]|uniref:Uncharacterized protein n=1 Tax=Chaetomium tenue TaxID=1854479 RepID=A0ACB7P2J0_9PEZI|nr:hypothetical protein F5144DRAFT_594218 [Chaetomium globosum]